MKKLLILLLLPLSLFAQVTVRGAMAGFTPSLNLDFTKGVMPSGLTFTRNSVGTYFDASGVMQTASTNTPRFDYDPVTLAIKGLLIEESRTNSIRNSSMVGAVSGSPGTLPNNWVSAGFTGLTRTISVGTENGMSYIDLNFSGTATGTSNYIYIDGSGIVTANQSQVWTGSCYAKWITGAIAGSLLIEERNSSNGLVRTNFQSISSSSSLFRNTNVATLQDATTAKINLVLLLTTASGTAYNFTIRIYAPQLELGAFATSYIPTTTAAVTRVDEVCTATTITGFFNKNEGSFLADFQTGIPNSSFFPGMIQFDDFTATNRILLCGQTSATTISAFLNVVSSGSGVQTANTASLNKSQFNKYAASWSVASSTINCVQTGGTVITRASTSIPTNLTRFLIGSTGGNKANGWFRKILCYPRQIPNSYLQYLTN